MFIKNSKKKEMAATEPESKSFPMVTSDIHKPALRSAMQSAVNHLVRLGAVHPAKGQTHIAAWHDRAHLDDWIRNPRKAEQVAVFSFSCDPEKSFLGGAFTRDIELKKQDILYCVELEDARQPSK